MNIDSRMLLQFVIVNRIEEVERSAALCGSSMVDSPCSPAPVLRGRVVLSFAMGMDRMSSSTLSSLIEWARVGVKGDVPSGNGNDHTVS